MSGTYTNTAEPSLCRWQSKAQLTLQYVTGWGGGLPGVRTRKTAGTLQSDFKHA